ncbi:MAG: hypothetical protein K2J47_08515 [Ruminococcus sp.]|nr:hypothetical protein [Ruminococcus sp.]
MHEIKEKFHNEVKRIGHKSDFSDRDVEMIHNLIDTIYKIHMLEDDDYSGDGEWEAYGNNGRGSSHAGRKRDSIGRYSRDGSKEHMLSKLEDMMHDAESDRMKSAIRKCINEIERD